MEVARRQAPPDSAFLGDLRTFYYWDSYEAPLRRGDLAMHELYLALFAHHPRWAKWLLVVRGILVAPLGLRRTRMADLDGIEIKPAYEVGDKIARFTLIAQSDDEIVTGGDDKHLDFRVSVRKIGVQGATHVALSTVVSPHNALGRAYLRAILPFHRAGVRAILANALAAGRI
ncbi:Protein of unknown function [Rhodospirillales bacterium URHD0017]|nr:Protein of unknown function [Rhodospirillales bacterium URHD0017]